MKTDNIAASMDSGDPDQLLTPRQVAGVLMIETDTLAKWRMGKGRTGPPFVKLGRSVRYPRSGLRKFIVLNTVENTAQAHFRSTKTSAGCGHSVGTAITLTPPRCGGPVSCRPKS